MSQAESSPSSASDMLAAYQARLGAGHLRRDQAQERVLSRLQALVEVTLDDHSEKTVAAFEAAIRARAEVVACYAVTGDMDFLLHVFAPDLASFSDFAMKALLRMPGVKGSRSSFIMQAVKSDLAWAPLPRLK